MNDAIVWLTIFVLAGFVGVEVISKVSSTPVSYTHLTLPTTPYV